MINNTTCYMNTETHTMNSTFYILWQGHDRQGIVNNTVMLTVQRHFSIALFDTLWHSYKRQNYKRQNGKRQNDERQNDKRQNDQKVEQSKGRTIKRQKRSKGRKKVEKKISLKHLMLNYHFQQSFLHLLLTDWQINRY